MLQVKYVCLIPVKENFKNVLQTCATALELPMKCLIFGIQRQNTKKFDFELRGISKFREVSQESLLLTETPSVCYLKILTASIACAGNPSHCKRLRVLRTFSVFAYLCWNSQRNGFVGLFVLTCDYRECSRYLRVSVGTPKLQLSRTRLPMS